MSTQLSSEFKWEKPSTRRYAPPGGQSSISLGDYTAPPTPSRAPATATKANGAEISPKGTPAKPAAVPQKISANGRRVGVAVCQAANLKAATVAELHKLGAETTVYEVMDPLQLPFAAKCLITNASVSVVVIMGFLVRDAHWCSKEVAAALVKTLLDLSLETNVPVVNGLCFSQVIGSDLLKLSERLAFGAANVGALSDSGKKSYAVTLPVSTEVTPGLHGSISRSMVSKRRSSVFTPTRTVPRELNSLLLGLRTSLKALGTTGIFQLGRRFRQADDDRSGVLNFHEFQMCMRDAHMDWTEGELKNVFEHFDTDSTGGISYDEFLLAVRGEISQRRAQLILEVFRVADKNKDGIISAADLKGTYDASQHPDVRNNKRSKEEVMEEFVGTFDTEVKDGKVTPEEWCRYYANISASIDNDDYFELMMRNAWHLPGNTSGKRVLATRADGTQTVEEVKDGPGMDDTDTQFMLESLRAQGLNVSSVELFGGVNTEKKKCAQKPAETSRSPSPEMDAKFLPFVRQGPGGNSTLVLG